MRDNLSNAAYAGDFDSIFEVLRLVEEIYGECWVDAPRLSVLSWVDILVRFWLTFSYRSEPIPNLWLVTSSPSCIHECANFGGTRSARYGWFQSVQKDKSLKLAKMLIVQEP